MAKTIAVVGVGPGIGMAVAAKFGREGFNVALLARNAKSLDGFVSKLEAAGVTAAAFPVDVLDRQGLATALEQAADRFGWIDVLEYGPAVRPESLRTPRNFSVENAQYQIDIAFLGAIAAVEAVLPGMLERKDGGLLFTLPASAIHPIGFTASRCVAASAALNYARVLNRDLAGSGVYAGIVPIAGLLIDSAMQAEVLNERGLPGVAAEDVADALWELYTRRDRAEIVVGDLNAIAKMAGL